jgi:nucleoid-associated protein YgaU
MSDHHNPSHVPGAEPNEVADEPGHGRAKRRRFSIAALAKRPRLSEHRSDSEHPTPRKRFPLPFSSETRVGIATVLSFVVLMAALVAFYNGRTRKPEKPTPKLALATKEPGAGASAGGSGDDEKSEAPAGAAPDARTVGDKKGNDDPFADVTSPPPLPKGGKRTATEAQGSDLDSTDATASSAPPRPSRSALAEMIADRPTGVPVPPKPSSGGAPVDDTPAGEQGGAGSPPAIPPLGPRSIARERNSELDAQPRSRDGDAPSSPPPLDRVPGEPEPFILPDKANTPTPRPEARPRVGLPPSGSGAAPSRTTTPGFEKPNKPIADESLDLASRDPRPVSADAPSGWVPVPNLGKNRRSDDGVTPGGPSLVAASKSAQRPGSAGASGTPVSRSHVVREGETFFTISQAYYGSGRYYRALWAVNRRVAPSLKEPMYVGMSIVVPPFEDLDARLFDRPAATAGATSGEVIRSTPAPRQDGDASLAAGSKSSGVVLPVGRPSSSGIDPISSDELTGLPQRKVGSKYPTYVVKKGDTYRSIARELLGTNERADEIRQLNLDAVSDSPRPPAGQPLRLPMDARLPQETRLR